MKENSIDRAISANTLVIGIMYGIMVIAIPAATGIARWANHEATISPYNRFTSSGISSFSSYGCDFIKPQITMSYVRNDPEDGEDGTG